MHQIQIVLTTLLESVTMAATDCHQLVVVNPYRTLFATGKSIIKLTCSYPGYLLNLHVIGTCKLKQWH
ncbi:hypothetical protein AB205_0031790, partial [Aquarana catesbeiana]